MAVKDGDIEEVITYILFIHPYILFIELNDFETQFREVNNERKTLHRI